MDNIKLFKKFTFKQILEIIKQALKDGKGHGLDKSFNIIDVHIKDNALLIFYFSEIKNRFVIYNDFAMIIAFIYSLLVGEFEENGIFNIGVNTQFVDKSVMYIVSPIESAKAISEGNAVFWLKNSIANEQLSDLNYSFLLVEGESETEAFPILFKSINVDIEKYKIKIIPYAKLNLRTMVSILNINKEPFYLVCDSDKSKEIKELAREGLLGNNFKILSKGEFEDYIDPKSLIEILKSFTPNIVFPIEYIENHRKKNVGTSKIVQKYYHKELIQCQCPPKPDVARKIAEYWAKNEIPKDFQDILTKMMNIHQVKNN